MKSLIALLEKLSPKGTFTHPENQGYVAGYRDAFDLVRKHLAESSSEPTVLAIPDEQPDEIITSEQMEKEDNDPVSNAYSAGYADGFKASAIKLESRDLTEEEKVEAVESLKKGWGKEYSNAKPGKFKPEKAWTSALASLLERFEVRRRP